MFADLRIARADGRLPKVLAAWARVDVLCIDDLALQPLTPAQGSDLLEVIADPDELAAAAGYEPEEGTYPLARLLAADEVFLSSSVREVMPVVAVDGAPVGDGRPGSAAAVLERALRDLATS